MPQDEPRPTRPEVAEGMAAARDRGVRLGRPPAALPAGAPRAAELQAAGNSLARIADALNAEQIPTPSGRGQWTKSSVQYVLTRYEQERTDEP